MGKYNIYSMTDSGETLVRVNYTKQLAEWVCNAMNAYNKVHEPGTVWVMQEISEQ